ncbi:MAG: hypothetical protein MUC31_05150, partial [Bacteroidales bacterium]|nr:hypothetical protein [Bacteroidales bacterium]
MKKNSPYFMISILLVTVATINALFNHEAGYEKKEIPNDWFFRQRAFPYQTINYEAVKLAWEESQRILTDLDGRGEGWVLKGPLNIGGRISAVAMHPSDLQTIYAGAASGGIFKTVKAGGSWIPVFEDAQSLS